MPVQDLLISLTLAAVAGPTPPGTLAAGHWSPDAAASPKGNRLGITITTPLADVTGYEAVVGGVAYPLYGGAAGRRVINLPDAAIGVLQSVQVRGMRGTTQGPLSAAKTQTPAKLARVATPAAASHTFADAFGGMVPFASPAAKVEVDGHLAIVLGVANSIVAGLLPALGPSATYTDAGGVTATGAYNLFMDTPQFADLGSLTVPPKQGFDAAGGVGPFGGGGYQPSTRIDYDATLGKHPDIAAIPFAAADNPRCLVQGYRASGDPLNVRSVIVHFRCLHLLKEAPPVGWVPPGAQDLDQEILVTDSEMDEALLPNLPLHSNSPTFAEAQAFNFPEVHIGLTGDKGHRFMPINHAGMSYYGAQQGVQFARLYEYLLSDNPAPNKRALLRNLAIRASSFAGWVKRRGTAGIAGAGQGRTYTWDPIIMFLVTGNSLWLDVARLTIGVSAVIGKRVTEPMIDSPLNLNYSNDGTGMFEAPFAPDDLNDFHYSLAGNSPSADVGYYSVNRPQCVIDGAMMLALTVFGTRLTSLLTDHAGPLAGRMAGIHAIMKEMRAYNAGAGGSGSVAPDQLAPWSAWAAFIDPRPQGQRPPRHFWTWLLNDQRTSRMSGGPGALNFDLAAIQGSTGSYDPVTALEVSISPQRLGMPGGVARVIQRQAMPGGDWTPTITQYGPGLPLNEEIHEGSFRLENANGIADWTDPRQRANTSRGGVASRIPRLSGAPLASGLPDRAPMWAVPPNVYAAEMPVTIKDWQPLGPAQADRIITGASLLRADAIASMKPVVAIQWSRERAVPTVADPLLQPLGQLTWGSVSLPAGIAAEELTAEGNVTTADIGRWHRMRAIVDNGIGRLEAVSLPFYIPAPAARPANHPVSLNFGPLEYLYYPDIYASIVTRGATKVINPFVFFEDRGASTPDVIAILPLSPGGLIASRTGAYPEWELNAGFFAAGTYRITAGLPVGVDKTGTISTLYSDWTAAGSFTISTGPSGAGSLLAGGVGSINISKNNAKVPYARFIDETIVVPSGGRNIYLRQRVNGSAASPAGGSPAVAQIDLFKVS